MATTEAVRTHDAVPVFSRISWGALLAGLFVTLAVFVLLSTLGLAIGISTVDVASGDTIAIGAGIWAVVTALLAFFCGGCVVSRFTAGESRNEAIVYGVVLWGAAFALILWTTGSILRTGSTMVVGTGNLAANRLDTAPQNWEQASRRAGVTETQIAQMRAEMPTAARAEEISMQAAWWSFAGIALSLAAAIGGAIAGAGPNPVIGGVLFRRVSPQPSPSI